MVVLLVGLVVVAGLALVFLYFRSQAAKQDTLLALLALAVDREMPLGPSLDSVADQFRGEFRRKVRALSHYVNSGVSLPDALDCEPGALARDAGLLARIGYESGTLAGALRQASANRGLLKPVWTGIAGRIAYFLFVLFVIEGVSGFLFFAIIPKYERILADFGVAPPPVTRLVIGFGHSIGQSFMLYWLLMIVQMIVLLSLPLTMLGWSRLDIPLVDRLFDRRHAALILRSISWVVEGGMSLSRALEILMDWYPSRRIRARLQRVSLDVKHGTDGVESLAHHGLISQADAAVLESARRTGNLPWALRETAESGERRLAYRLQGFLQLLLPLILFALGGLVALLVVAYLTPLFKVIEVLL